MDYNIPMLASAAHVPQMPMQSPDSQLPLQVQPFQTVNPVAQEHQAMKMIGERNQMQDEQRQREEANNERASLEALHSSGVNLSTPEGIDEALQKQGWSQKTIDGLLKRKQAILTNASLMQEHLSKVDARKLADIHSTMEETLRDMTRPMEKYDAAIKSGKDTVAATSAFNDTAAAIVTYYRGRKNADGTPLVPPEKLEQMAKWSVDDWRHNVDEADFKVKQVSTALKNKKYQAETGLIEKKTQLLEVEDVGVGPAPPKITEAAVRRIALLHPGGHREEALESLGVHGGLAQGEGIGEQIAGRHFANGIVLHRAPQPLPILHGLLHDRRIGADLPARGSGRLGKQSGGERQQAQRQEET